MADLGYYDDKLMQNDQQQPGGGVSNTVTPTAGTSGVVSGSNNSNVSTAGVGAGGTGGWTNIQSYLSANQGDHGSSQNLQEKVGGQYDKENQNLVTQANDTKTQAQNEANKVNEAKDNSKEWVNQAANAYSWTGNQNEDYKGTVGKLQSALYDPYKGPNNFAYTTSNDFQRANTALKDDPSFGNYMKDIYSEKAGGQLTQGQGALQNQLDVNNQQLADTRKNLLNQYAGFGDKVNAAVTDADSAIQKARQDYGNNQTGLMDYLGNYGDETYTKEQQAEMDARAAYNKDYTTGKSGQQNVGKLYSDLTNNGKNLAGGWFQVPGDVGTDANSTWEGLQKENNPVNLQYGNANYDFSSLWGRSPTPGWYPHDSRVSWVTDPLKAQYGDNQNVLNKWYGEQDQKYANTGDAEKRQWNVINELLKKDDRMSEGFKVRG